MKMIANVVDVEGEGLISLIGRRVTFFCLNYIYTGDLVGVNETCVKLENPAVVYETGPFTDGKWRDAQDLLSEEFYVATACIESFGIVK